MAKTKFLQDLDFFETFFYCKKVSNFKKAIEAIKTLGRWAEFEMDSQDFVLN